MVDNIKIQRNISLKPYTSMYVGGSAQYFTEVTSIEDLKISLNFSKENKIPVFILGGGSNIVVSDNGFAGLVIKIKILGIKKISEDDNFVCFEVGAGESWDEFVKFSIDQSLFGIENLSHIPGTVGASVVQNIGAYGAEVGTSIYSVNVLETKSLTEKVLMHKDLNFLYRKSILNTSEKGKYVVTSVVFRLKKSGLLNTDYTDIKKYFIDKKVESLSLRSLREAIIFIRDKKFPYPDSPEHGTSGSFWNADVVNDQNFENIILKLRELGCDEKAKEMESKKGVFVVSQGLKVPYGLLIESLGFKGRVVGGVKILETHSGVINNFTGKGTARDVLELSCAVVDAVKETYDVCLNIEPELVGDFN